MKRKCDTCDRPATYHSVEIVKGEKIEKHLCDQHAQEEGLTPTGVHTPINELLTNFVKLHSSAPVRKELACETCGLKFEEFREHSLLGCPDCYEAFDEPLGSLLERAQGGATHHIGKVPRRAGATERQQIHVLRMRKKLDEAVAREDYETAAKLHDDIRHLEEET